MALKNILVHLDQTPKSPERFALALALAKKHQARLTAFFATASPYFSQGADRQQREALHGQCVEQAATLGVELEWAVDDDTQAGQSLVTRICQQGYFADLIVVGQAGAKFQPPPAPPRDLPERLILSSGRPVLTVPFAGSFPTLGERVMVAWKNGRPATRAVADTLPLLKASKDVLLISFAGSPGERERDEEALAKLAAYLKLHDVSARTEARQISGISVGDALLNRVAEEGISLLVAGGMAPAHGGPMANHLLRDMTVPVVMAS